MSEQDTARRATCSAFAVKICGMEPKTQGYHGDFPYMDVVNSAPVPAIGEHKHAYHWGELFRIFDEEWRKYGS
jgi:hypothetical protein